VERAVRAARVVTTLTSDQAARVSSAFPALAGEIRVVPHGVDVVGPRDPAFLARHGVAPDEPVVVHVAGIRREKGFPECWSLVDAMRAAVPGLRYVHAGPVLDPKLADETDAAFAARPWAVRLGALARDRVLDATAGATLTLHASVVEGLSNALLESMALGVAVLARDIPATRAAVEDGVTGLTFRTDAEAAAAARRLAGDAALCARLTAAARRVVAERFSTEAETGGYLAAYAAAR
jgi:glycosyltransferase involved in cell wall biosynthesis